MQIGSFKISTPMALLAGGGLFCVACCAIGLVTNAVGDATRSPADKTATVLVRSFTATPRPAATPRPEATAVPAAALGKVGEPQASGGIELTVVKVETAPRGALGAPKAGNQYLNAQVSIKSIDRDKAPYNPLYFKVKDSGGFEYTGSLVGPEPSLKSGELNKGEQVAGWVSFEVPTEATGFVVSYQPLVIFGGYQTIRIDLGR